MSEKLEELISLLYQDRLTQYGKRSLVKNIEKLQKENEELKIKNNAIKRESEAYAEYMIRLDIEKQDYFEKYRYYLQQNESLTKEFSNVIPIQKVKDKIEELKSNPLKIKQNDKYYFETHAYNKIIISVLQELIEAKEVE